jgi:hypothetical protein
VCNSSALSHRYKCQEIADIKEILRRLRPQSAITRLDSNLSIYPLAIHNALPLACCI